MAIVTIAEIAKLVGSGEQLMGLDIGEKTIGLAVGAPSIGVASPLDTIRRTKFTADAERLFALIDENRIAGLVIGLPVNMDGSEGPRCQSVRQFAANLIERRETAIAFWDERLSTAAVTRAMIDADLTRQKRARSVDKLAAAYILQGALDALAHQSTN